MAKGFNLTAEINLRGPSNVKTVIADIRRQLGTIDTAVTVKIDPQAANNANKLSTVLTRLNNVLTTTSTQSRLTATNITQLANALNSFQTSANAASRSLNGLPRNIAQTTQGIQRAAQQAATARTEIEEFGRQSALAVRRFAAFSVATGAIYSLINATTKATKEFIEFDRQIVRLTQITGDSYEQLGGLTSTITKLSTSLGVASSDLIGVADTLAQAGLSAKETEQALKALALTAVAPSFDKLSDTVEGSIALMRQFSISTKDLEKALSSINSVAAKFAVESSDIITAIQRTGGVFSAASKGVSEGTDALNEFIAVFTSVRATTRESAETIATGLRTIFTRIQRADTIEALKDYGVTLTDVQGKFVGAYKAVELLAQGLGRLDPRDLKFSQIVEELGGFRQIGKVLPLIQQFSTAQDALKTAYAGQGSLATDAAKAQASLAIQFAKTREEFVALIRDIGNSDSFKSLVSVGLTLANTFIKVAEVAKPLLPILTSIAAVKGSEALYQFGSGFLGGFARSTPNSVGQNAGQALSGARNQQNAATAVNNTRALGSNTTALQSLTTAVQQLNSTITNNRRTGPQTINKGGVVKAFARGGVVPGTGNSDTVPAMLQPGEFVIRKKAVETIGANNLHRMNKYGSGGSIRTGAGKRKRFASGGRAPEPQEVINQTVRDGDSLNVQFTPKAESYNSSSRLLGIDTYELNSGPKWRRNLGAAAKQETELFYKSNQNVTKDFEEGYKRTGGGKDKYGRPFFANDDLKNKLLSKGLGYEYNGATKETELTKEKYLELYPQNTTIVNRRNIGGLIQKFAKGGKTKKVEGLLMSALKGYKDDLFGSSLPDILKTQGLSNILDKIEKAYGVSAARVIGAGGENVAFDIGQEILKISRTGSGAQQLLRDYGVNKKAIQKIGNYQLPSNVPGVTGYRNIKAFGKLTAALQDKVSSTDSEKSLRDYELLQGKLAKAGQYWLDAGPSNMGYDKKGNPTVIDGLVFSKAFVNKNVGKDSREDIEVEGMMAEDIYDRWSKKQKSRQKFAVGGLAGLKQTATRRVGIIDTDVLRDPTNKDKVSAAMEKLGLTDTSEYSIELAKKAAAARKAGSLLRLRAIAGAAGSGKSSLATGLGANDDATLRRTIRSQILTPEDISNVDEVLALTSTASDNKLEAYLRNVDRAYILSSSTAEERDRVTSNREQRDKTGQGLYGRKPGQTAGATTDFALDETVLRDELGSKAMVLGRKTGSYGLRRKRDDELPEIVQAGGFYTGGFAPPTRGHRGALESLLARMIEKNPKASLEDIVVSVAPNLPMTEGSEGIDHAARYGIFPTDFRALLSRINFGNAMISTQDQPPGSLPKFMEVQGSGNRRRFARLRGAMAVTSGKEEGVLGKYERAGIQVEDIPRIDDISATKVRDALFRGDDKLLNEYLNPEIASILMGNRVQLRNRSVMVPMLLDKIKEVVEIEKANSNAQVDKLLESAPGGPYKNVSAKLRQNAPEFAEQIKQIRAQRDSMARGAFGYRAYNVIQALASQYPELYGLDPSKRSSVSASAPDLEKGMVLSQITEGMKGVFASTSTGAPESGLQQAILSRVEKETATRGSGILPASNEDILSQLGDQVIPNDSKFGKFAGKAIADHTKKGKRRLPYWFTDYKTFMRRPGEIAGLTEADVETYAATRDYVIGLFNQSKGNNQQAILDATAQKIAQTKLLAIVGLQGDSGLQGPLTWNLGNNAAGEPVSVSATIMERVLPAKYKAVADYINAQTGNIVKTAAGMMTGVEPNKQLDAKKREVLNQGNIEGGIFEQLLATLGADVLDDAARTRAIDFPSGIGDVAGKIFGIDPDIPTEAKRTINSTSRAKAIEEFQRYFRGVYGVQEPAGDMVQQLARGGKVGNLLAKYKDIIKSIMPADYIAEDGFLRTPDGGSFDISVKQSKRSGFSDTIDRLLGVYAKPSASYSGGVGNLVKTNLQQNKNLFDPRDYEEILSYVEKTYDQKRQIDIPPGEEASLSHESFHSIQDYLSRYYPQTLTKLNSAAQNRKADFIKIYETSPINKLYKLDTLFSETGADSVYRGALTGLELQKENYKKPTQKNIDSIIGSSAKEMGRNEIIPLLISAAREYQDQRAETLLSDIFAEAGLNKDFASTMPKGYFWGGKVDPLAKKYGLSQSEFEEQKKIAKFMGLSDKDFEEKLRLFASQKKRVKGAKFAALDSLADSSTSVSRLTAEQQALNEFLQTNKFAEGGAATLEKASKNYGKIALRNDGSSISANYFKQGADALLGGATMRSGHIMASKIDSDLYQVGLSGATKGYGPRLYDVVMEAVTENGAMLTSDRSLVSGDAKRVWEYYFNNRGDVKKTPLKPKNWTKNQSLIDPKLYGREETWPPSTDPAWILQSGYSKAPSLINDPNAVVRSDKQQDTRSMALQYFQRAATGGSIRRFAQGGSAEDTVPALLTPGEFVINKKAAQSIGYGRLQKLNHADKLKGYNKGGIVGGIQRFNVGGNVASDAQLVAVSDAMSKALRGLPESIADLVREFNVQTTQLKLGDTFDAISLKLRQQMLIAQKDISNLGPEFVEGVRKVLGAGISQLDNIERDTIRSSPSYKGPGTQYYDDVEKAKAGRKTFESGAAGIDNIMEAMRRSVAGPGGTGGYPKPLVSTTNSKPEDYYSRLDYSDIGPSRGVNDRGQLYAKALAGEDPIKVNALVEKLRKEMEDAARAAGIAISKWGKSESWAMWDVGKQLHMQKNPNESSSKYRLANPLEDAKIQKEIVQRHLAWEATGGRDSTTGERLSSSDLKDLGEKIMAQVEATKAQTEATKAQTTAIDPSSYTFSANVGSGIPTVNPATGAPNPTGPSGPANPYTRVLPSGIRFDPVARAARRSARENNPEVLDRYAQKFNNTVEKVANRANALGGGLAVALESTSKFVGSTTVAGKTLSSLSYSASSLAANFYQASQAVRALGNFADSKLGQRLLGSFSKAFNTRSLNQFFGKQRDFLGGSTIGTVATSFAAGAAAAVALTDAFISYNNALKESRIEAAQKRQEEALTKSAEALEEYAKTQEKANLVSANVFATSASRDALNEVNLKSTGNQKFGMQTGAAVGGGALVGGAIGSFIAPVIGTAIGAAIGGSLTGIVAQLRGADSQRGTTAEESSRLLTNPRSRLFNVYGERFKAGETSEDIMRSPDWQTQSELLARANAEVEAILRSVEANRTLTDDQKKARTAELIQIEASAQLRQQEQIWLKQKGLIELDNATKAYSRSLKNMFSNMDEAINRSASVLENFASSLELAEMSVKGQAKIGILKSEAANIIKNPRAVTSQESTGAINAASSFFGSERNTINQLLTIGPKIESSVLAAIQAAQTLPGSTTDEAIAASIRRSVRDELSGSGLPQELSDKLGQRVMEAIDKRRQSGDDKIDFRDLEEDIPQLKDSIDALKGAQEIAIKALEDYVQKVGVLVDKTNVSVDLLLQASEFNKKASETRFGGMLQLNKSFGSGVDVGGIQDFRNATLRNQTGGLSSPEAILANINKLENRRLFQQEQLQGAKERGRAGTRDVLAFTDQLSRTTRSLRDNQKALEDLAANSEAASAALEKISELQAKTQAGQNIIEKYVTSTKEDNYKLSAAFERLSNNMQGMLNSPFASKNVRDAMQESDNPALAADQAAAQDRRDTLEAFNMIAPFLGNNKEQNNIKANVLESMLKETGIGLTPMFNDVLKSLRNPESDSEMSQLVDQYKKAIEVQGKANEALAELNTNFAQNIKQSSEEAFKNAITSTLVDFERAQTAHLAKIEEILSRQPVATGKASGGIVYRDGGGSIFKAQGTDTVPAMLTPGEFVVNKASTQKYGSVLHAINNNKYSEGGKVRYYNKGGYVSPVLRDEAGFIADASKAETDAFGLSADYYQKAKPGAANKFFSKNRHYNLDALEKLLSPGGAAPLYLYSIEGDPSVIPLDLTPVAPETYSVKGYWTSSAYQDLWKQFINKGVTARSVGIGYYPSYAFSTDLGDEVFGYNAAEEVKLKTVGPSTGIPETLFKPSSFDVNKKQYLLWDNTLWDRIQKLKDQTSEIAQGIDFKNYDIYNRQKFTNQMSNYVGAWSTKGKELFKSFVTSDGRTVETIVANLNNLKYSNTLASKGKTPVFLTASANPVVSDMVSGLSNRVAAGVSVSNSQIVTGDIDKARGGAGGFSVQDSSQARYSNKMSFLNYSDIYQTDQDDISNNASSLTAVQADLIKLEEELQRPNDYFLQDKNIYTNKYSLYQDALENISKGILEKAKFQKNILDEAELGKLKSLKNTSLDFGKLTDLYVWSKKALDPKKIRNNPKYQTGSVGIDFPIEDKNTNTVDQFVWSLSANDITSDFIANLGAFKKNQFLTQENFTETFDAPWAIDKKIGIEFPFQMLKNLPIYDYNTASIAKEYSGFSLDQSTFNRSGDNKTFNPFKIATKDYDYPEILLASSATEAKKLLSEKIKQWIDSNGGQVPTKAPNLGVLDKLARMSMDDLKAITDGTDLTRETNNARTDIFGSLGDKYQQLASIGVLYRPDGEANFTAQDLDPSILTDFRNKVDLAGAFGGKTLSQTFPAYANGNLRIKNELIKSKESVLQDFINQSSISNFRLSELAPWVKNLSDSRVGDLFNNGPEVPDNLRKVYMQTLAWNGDRNTADLMNQTEAMHPGAFQELMSLLQLGFYLNGGKTQSAADTLATQFKQLQQGYFGTQDLDKLSVFEDSRVAGKRGKQWWKALGPDWDGFARYNLGIISRKGEVEDLQNILNKASAASFSAEDANNLAAGIQSMEIGDKGLGVFGNEETAVAKNAKDLILKLLNTNKTYTEGYRLDIADTIQKLSLPGGANDPLLNNVKNLLDPAGDLISYLAFKDAIISRPISDVRGVKVQGDNSEIEIKAPRLANYADDADKINNNNPWDMYTAFMDNVNFNNMLSSFNKVTSMIGGDATSFKLQNPSSIYKGPDDTFDGKPYVNDKYRAADPILGNGAYVSAYRALAGTDYKTLFEKDKKGEQALQDSTKEDKNVIYRSSGGPVGYYAGGGSIANFQPKGTDTVPAMLTPGEFVINRAATQKHLPLLQAINSQNYQTGGMVQYLATGSKEPVKQQGLSGLLNKFLRYISRAPNEEIIALGRNAQTLSDKDLKQLMIKNRGSAYSNDPRSPKMAENPDQTLPYFPSARSIASQQNRLDNPYTLPAEDPTAYSPSSRAEASRKARESYKPEYSAEAYITNEEAAQARKEIIKQYRIRKDNLIREALMVEKGPIESIKFATPTLTFESWDKVGRTDGKIVSYDAAKEAIAIYKIGGTDILKPKGKTGAVTAVALNTLSVATQDAIASFMATREQSPDTPYPYQRKGMNAAIEGLEQTHGKDFMKEYRNKNRISIISSNAGPIYNPNQGYIASTLSDFLLSTILKKNYPAPTAEAVPQDQTPVDAQKKTYAYTSAKTDAVTKAQTAKSKATPSNVSDEVKVDGQEMRRWIDATEKYAVVAKLISFLHKNQDIKLLRSDNRSVVVPITKLSDFDQDYVRKLQPNYKQFGGIIYANDGQYINFQPKGTDTVPAMLTPGEFVVNRRATQKHLPLLQSINNASSSKSYSSGGIAYLQGGGIAGMISNALNAAGAGMQAFNAKSPEERADKLGQVAAYTGKTVKDSATGVTEYYSGAAAVGKDSTVIESLKEKASKASELGKSIAPYIYLLSHAANVVDAIVMANEAQAKYEHGDTGSGNYYAGKSVIAGTKGFADLLNLAKGLNPSDKAFSGFATGFGRFVYVASMLNDAAGALNTDPKSTGLYENSLGRRMLYKGVTGSDKAADTVGESYLNIAKTVSNAVGVLGPSPPVIVGGLLVGAGMETAKLIEAANKAASDAGNVVGQSRMSRVAGLDQYLDKSSPEFGSEKWLNKIIPLDVPMEYLATYINGGGSNFRRGRDGKLSPAWDIDNRINWLLSPNKGAGPNNSFLWDLIYSQDLTLGQIGEQLSRVSSPKAIKEDINRVAYIKNLGEFQYGTSMLSEPQVYTGIQKEAFEQNFGSEALKNIPQIFSNVNYLEKSKLPSVRGVKNKGLFGMGTTEDEVTKALDQQRKDLNNILPTEQGLYQQVQLPSYKDALDYYDVYLRVLEHNAEANSKNYGGDANNKTLTGIRSKIEENNNNRMTASGSLDEIAGSLMKYTAMDSVMSTGFSQSLWNVLSARLQELNAYFGNGDTPTKEAEGMARGGLVGELSGLYQRRLTAQKEAAAAMDQWFVVPLKANKAGDTSTIFDNKGNRLPANELLTLNDNELATMYGKDSSKLTKEAKTKYPWFDAKQHRLVMGQGIYNAQKTAFTKQDPGLKMIDELAYEYKNMPSVFESKNKAAYTDEAIDPNTLVASLKDKQGAYVEAKTKSAAEMLQGRKNFLNTLWANLDEAYDLVWDYISANGRDNRGKDIRAAFGGDDPDNILTTQQAAVGGEIENISKVLKDAEIDKYAKNVKNNFNKSRILDFANAPKSLQAIIDYFKQNKPQEKTDTQAKPSSSQQAQNKQFGGVVYASGGRYINFQPKGTDTVPAMLTPGEFVVNRRATQQNLPLLKQINSQTYQKGGVVQYYQQGSQNPVKQSGVGGMYSLSLDDKSISLIREFTSKFAEFSNKLANLNLPTIRIDETTLTSLNDFTKRFDNFSKELLKLNIPPVITITGKHDVNVNINGASVFSNMDKYVSNMIKNEINNAFAQLARETDGAISMNYNPSAYSNQNTQNLA